MAISPFGGRLHRITGCNPCRLTPCTTNRSTSRARPVARDAASIVQAAEDRGAVTYWVVVQCTRSCSSSPSRSSPCSPRRHKDGARNPSLTIRLKDPARCWFLYPAWVAFTSAHAHLRAQSSGPRTGRARVPPGGRWAIIPGLQRSARADGRLWGAALNHRRAAAARTRPCPRRAASTRLRVSSFLSSDVM